MRRMNSLIVIVMVAMGCTQPQPENEERGTFGPSFEIADFAEEGDGLGGVGENHVSEQEDHGLLAVTGLWLGPGAVGGRSAPGSG